MGLISSNRYNFKYMKTPQNPQLHKHSVMPRLSFQDLKISKEDVEQCVKTNHSRKFEGGW